MDTLPGSLRTVLRRPSRKVLLPCLHSLCGTVNPWVVPQTGPTVTLPSCPPTSPFSPVRLPSLRGPLCVLDTPPGPPQGLPPRVHPVDRLFFEGDVPPLIFPLTRGGRTDGSPGHSLPPLRSLGRSSRCAQGEPVRPTLPKRRPCDTDLRGPEGGNRTVPPGRATSRDMIRTRGQNPCQDGVGGVRRSGRTGRGTSDVWVTGTEEGRRSKAGSRARSPDGPSREQWSGVTVRG